MARITDTSKIERLKEATMKLVAEKGYGGASAASIAVQAKVSTGYFYMHYKGKYEMVNSLLLDVYSEVANKLDELINEGSSFYTLIENLVDFYFDMANNEPVKIKFFYVLSSDYYFTPDDEVKNSIFGYIDKVMEIGMKENQLDETIKRDDLYLLLVVFIIQYINQRFKNNPNQPIAKENKDHFLYLLNKTLKK